MAFIIDGSTGIATVDGSVSAPSQRGQDSNSGISYAADTIKFSTNGVERMAITNSGVTGTGIGGGKVLQVVSTTYTGQTTFNSEAGAIVSGMTRTITPTAASSKILIAVDINFTISAANYTSWINLRRGGSVITGSQATNMNTNQNASFKPQRCSGSDIPEVMAGTYLDTPSYTLGDTLTYEVYFHQESGSTAYINFFGGNNALSYFTRFVSTQTLFEVAA